MITMSRLTLAPRRESSRAFRKHEARHTAAAEESVLMIEAGSDILFSSADDNHQGQQMFFARMRNTRRRGGFPGGQRGGALAEISAFDSALKPFVERGRRHFRFRAQHPEVVVARPAPDDKYAFVPQCGQRTPGGKMLLRIEPALQRELDYWNVCVGKDDCQRYERPMIESPSRVEVSSDTCAYEQFPHPLRKVRRAGRGVMNLVSVFRKAAVVVKHRRPGMAHNGEVLFLPVG